MKILIVTPLYPPDIAGSAPYVKELATRLRSIHSVTILAYNHIPESIEQVRIIPVEKSDSLYVRLFRFTKILIHEMSETDIVFVENGPSVEIPLFLACLVRKRKVVFHLGDATALRHATMSLWYRLCLKLALISADQVLAHSDVRIVDTDPDWIQSVRPNARPEILPFQDFPKEAFLSYERSWQDHIRTLGNIFRKS